MSRHADRIGRHGWNSLQGYFNAHVRRMADLENEGFLVRDGLAQHWGKGEFLVLEGRLRCKHGLFVDVLKYLNVRRYPTRTLVRTNRYRYHAGVEGDANRPIFRYVNTDAKPGHAGAHHKHRFDPTTWREIEPPLWIGEERWPHLSDVVDELRDWWETTGRHLRLEAPRGEE